MRAVPIVRRTHPQELRFFRSAQGDGPRVVLDIKFTHPDLHRTRGLGTFTSMPQWHARPVTGVGGGSAPMDIETRVPHMTNQLIEKLAALDGDMGRESQTAYMAVMARYGQPYIDALCADLQLDVRGNEMRGGTCTMDPDHFNKPFGKRVCLRRLLKVRTGLVALLRKILPRPPPFPNPVCALRAFEFVLFVLPAHV